MNEELFDINNFNIIQDAENYYFFRALNNADNADIESGIVMSEDGKIERIRTDRERKEEAVKYDENSNLSLEEIFDHIKTRHSKDTNCISLTSNGNVAIDYGRDIYNDKYIMVKIPKKELGKDVVFAGKYMLQELYSKIEKVVENLSEDKKQEVLNIFKTIEQSTENKMLKEIIAKRYIVKNGEVDSNKAHLRRGIVYGSPKARICSYQALSKEQLLEVNKVYAKLAILENENILEKVIPYAQNSKFREAIGNAFSSVELIHYKDIKKENIIEVSKEIVDVFALIQQLDNADKNKIEELKQVVLMAMQSGKQFSQISEIEERVKDNITIEEMYELTEGKVEYGKADSIVKNMFYLSKSRQNAIELSNLLKEILGDNVSFEDIIENIRKNGFRIEPEIIIRQSGKGVKLSEAVNLNLQKEEKQLVDEIKELSSEELNAVLKSGGLYNARNIITRAFSNVREDEKIEKSRYYAEAIISKYNWNDIGILEFKTAERNELIKRLQERDCVEIYNRLKEKGIEESKISTVLLNIATRDGFYEQYKNGDLEELLNTRQDVLFDNINIEIVERFLGYYDVENTNIKLKDYQARAYNNVNKIFEDEKFAQVILPTGAGKSFVALAQMNKYAKEHQNEKMLYLAPQEEILNQIKNYIVKYIHGKKETVGKTVDEIIAEVFPNITFETYSGLLAKRGKEAIKDEYGMIVLDELHRTGAKEWEEKLDELLGNQSDNVKVLGITATPIRDVDGRNMANEVAKKLGYTDEEIKKRKHIASNMTLENAIRIGYVVNPKLVYCKYDLISSGKMDELKLMINDIEDEVKKEEELEKYNKLREKLNKEIDEEIGEEARKKLEEEARKNLDNGIGKEKILKQNIKKGGKYIVFIPVTDQGDIEDEEGNRIGAKTGEEKIKAYQEYLNEVFEETDIELSLHSLLGLYSKEKNKEEIEAFEVDNSEKTKFMVVMNKANEGLHIDGVDGIIWFRALDENSRILYLQQLGRAIFALDEDNPLPEDKRPIVIDLVNNSLTVKMEKEFENAKSIDDLESLIIVLEWIDEHDGILPNGNSTNKQEQHYYAVLRRIQNKYFKYLDGFENFEELKEEEKNEIQEIIELAPKIDLWNIDLPPVISEKENKGDVNPFEITGVLREFIELNDEVDKIEKERFIERFIRVCESLKKQEFNFNNFTYTKVIEENGEKKIKFKTLGDVMLECPNIDIDKILEETGVKLNYSIGRGKTIAGMAIQDKGGYSIKDDEKLKLIQWKIVNLEKETSMEKFLRVCEALSRQNFDFKNFNFSERIKKNGKKMQRYKTLRDIVKEYSNIDIEKVLEESDVTLDYSIGSAKGQAIQYNKDNKTNLLPEYIQKRLIKLGVIGLEKESIMLVFVRVCESLEKQEFDFENFHPTKLVEKNGKKIKKYKTLEDISEEYSNLDIKKVLDETGVDLDYSIGYAKGQALAAISGKRKILIEEEEEKKLMKMGVIKLEKQTSMSIFLNVCEELYKQNFNFRELKTVISFKEKGKRKERNTTLRDIKEEYPNIDMEKILEETGVDLDYTIGLKKVNLLQIIKEKRKAPLLKEEKQRFVELGVIKENVLEQAKQERDNAKEKNNEVRQLEEQVEEELKKRGKLHEE